MSTIRKSVFALIILVALFMATAAASAQSAGCPAMGGELTVPVGALHPDAALAAQGYTCVENEDGSFTFTIVVPPQTGSFDLSEDLDRLVFSADGEEFNIPVNMLVISFPRSGEVVDGFFNFEIDDVEYSIEIEDQLVEVEIAESAAQNLPFLNTSDVEIDTTPGIDGNGICESVQTTFDEQFDNLGNPLNQPRRIDLSFREGQRWHLDYYKQPGQDAFSIYGFGGEQRVVLLGYGSIWVFELGADCADYDLEADVRNYRTLRGTNQPNSFVLLNSGIGWHVSDFIAEEQPEINLFDLEESEFPPYTIYELGNDPLEIGVQESVQSAVNATCVITSNSSFNVRAQMSTTSAATAQNAGTVLTATALSTPDSSGFRWWTVPTGFVREDAVTTVGTCALLGTTSSSPSVVAPAVRPATTGASCAPATQQVIADGREVAGPVNIEAHSSPINGNVVIPAGITVTGFNGAVWGYTTQACAEQDLTTSGKTYTVYGQ